MSTPAPGWHLGVASRVGWPPDRSWMGFTREQLQAFHGATVDDLLGPGLRLLFVGINPGLWTAATNTHFASPSNRFYPALHRAGITARRLHGVDGLSDADREHLLDRGVGITNVVARATGRADELTRAELRSGSKDLVARVEQLAPVVVAVAGITAYRDAFEAPQARLGEQPERLAGARLWVVPNPSGLNAHETIDSLAGWYRPPALAAGLDLSAR